MVADAGTGLAAAHSRGVVHRDVKPANLLLTPDGRVKVADFGIARAADSVALTTTGMLIGTAAYISPEQVSGNAATPASDVYSLGVVAHQCLTGSPPFSADGEIATALARLSHPVPPLPADVPPLLAELVMSMMAREPSARPSALAVADRARQLVDDPIPATVEQPAPTPTRVLPIAPAPAISNQRLRWSWRSRRAGWLAALAVGAAAAIVVPVLLLGGRTDGGAAPTPSRSPVPAQHPRASPTASASIGTVSTGKSQPPGPGAGAGHPPGHGPGPGPGRGQGRGHQHGPGGPPGHDH
jgi:serine/threonine-protein kinase